MHQSNASPDWTATRVVVVALCFLLNMLDGTDLLIMSFIAPVLSADWSVGPERLGVLFSASLAGMAVGCLFVAPFADRFGRRPMLLAALAVTSAAMILSGMAGTVGQLMLARLVVGVGVGTIGVTMTTMAAEYAPGRHTSFAVGFVQAGWPFGSILTAFAAARMIPGTSWQSLLMGIGAFSVLLLVLIAFALPESLSFLFLRQPANALARINAIRRRLSLAALTELPPAAPKVHGIGVAVLFREGRARSSILLWSAVALGYFDLYFVISWIPKLASQAGLPLAQAIYAGATYNLGAFIGTAAVGWIAIRHPLNRVMACYFGAATLAMLIFGGVAMPVWLTLVVAGVVGITVQGGFNGFWALAARVYPAHMRSTGVGWALGLGRGGAVLGPVVGGLMVGAHFSLRVIFAAFAVPLVIAAFMTLRIDER